MTNKGIFIVFEGPDYSGKSTQIRLLADHLRRARRRKIVTLREPGGTPIGDKIREILLDHRNRRMTAETELFLYMASRAQLVRERLIPLLKSGAVILCDRYLFSSAAYQGAAGGIGIDAVMRIGELAVQGVMPDLTLILDIDPARAHRGSRRGRDRVERKGTSYQRKVRNGFLELARRYKKSTRIVNAARPITMVQEDIRRVVTDELF